MRGTPEQRFWDKVWLGDGCWLWTGKLRTGASPGHGKEVGYGQFYNGHRTVGPHRFAYELMVGPIPEGLVIDHLCRERACVNPDHLEAVTTQENILRGLAPTAENASKTHCVRGHELSGDNLYVPPKGGRYCRTCREAVQKGRKRNRSKLAILDGRPLWTRPEISKEWLDGLIDGALNDLGAKYGYHLEQRVIRKVALDEFRDAILSALLERQEP